MLGRGIASTLAAAAALGMTSVSNGFAAALRDLVPPLQPRKPSKRAGHRGGRTEALQFAAARVEAVDTGASPRATARRAGRGPRRAMFQTLKHRTGGARQARRWRSEDLRAVMGRGPRLGAI